MILGNPTETTMGSDEKRSGDDKAALLQKIADEAERGVLCTVDQKQPVPEVTSAKPPNLS